MGNVFALNKEQAFFRTISSAINTNINFITVKTTIQYIHAPRANLSGLRLSAKLGTVYVGTS